MITIPLLKRIMSVGTSRVVSVLHSQPSVVETAMRGGLQSLFLTMIVDVV